VELVTPGERDLDALMTMMEAFNRFESIVWTRATGEAPLRQLIGEPSLGFVVLARETADAPNLGYAVVTFGFDLEWGGRDAFLTELWLEPEARGHGVGARVLAAVERKARAEGARAMHLMVRHANANAQALYRRAGYGVPDRLFMTRRLPD
jgi:ribosomal protein S18 acetylase RimI-like enzyme